MLRTFRRDPPVDRLKSIDQFRACTMAQLRGVARLAEHVRVDRGETLVREGQSDRELFLILTGTVEVTQAGRRVNTLGACDFFGELGALNRGPRSATVTALSDVELLVVGPRELDSLTQIPGFRNALMKRMANRLRTVDARLAAADGQEAFGSQDNSNEDRPSAPFTSVHGAITGENHAQVITEDRIQDADNVF